jgi:hypothetical protein
MNSIRKFRLTAVTLAFAILIAAQFSNTDAKACSGHNVNTNFGYSEELMTMPSALSCIRYYRSSDDWVNKACTGDYVKIVAQNNCGRTRHMEICILKNNGKWDCGSEWVSAGEKMAYWSCNATNEVRVTDVTD